MPNCEFTKEEIVIPDKKIILNFSTDDMKDGISFIMQLCLIKERNIILKAIP